MNAKPTDFWLNSADAIKTWRNYAVHVGNVSGFASLHDSRRALTTDLVALNEMVTWVEVVDWAHGLSFEPPPGQHTVERVWSCLDSFDFAFGLDVEKEIERIREDHPPLLAARLVALLRLKLVREHFERLLRVINRVLAVVTRLVRTPAFVSNLIVRQSAFFVIHGEHPPRESARVVFGSIFRAGEWPA